MELTKTIEFTLMIAIGAFIVLTIFTSGYNNTANPTSSLESHAFTANNTNYSLDHPTANTDMKLYFFQNTTYQIGSSYFGYNSTHVRLYSNATYNPNQTLAWNCGGITNITDNCTYYASYTYQQPFTLWGTSYTSVMSVLVVIILLICIFIIWKATKLK